MTEKVEEMAKRKICMALDGINGLGDIRKSPVEAEHRLRDRLENFPGTVGLVKVGKALFTCIGPRAIEIAREHGYEVFLDLKFHDIPNTVKEASYQATVQGVSMFNVHALGGVEMMKAAMEGAQNAAQEFNIPTPIILGVTILTSSTKETLNNDLGIPGEVSTSVLRLAQNAHEAGLDGVVCSPKELNMLRENSSELPSDFICVTPGVRPQWSAKNDQQRVTTPHDAITAGADYLVIGRPIYDHPTSEEQIAASQKILDEVTEAIMV